MDLLNFDADDSEYSSEESSEVQMNVAAAGATPPRPAGSSQKGSRAPRIFQPVYHLDKFSGKENLNEWEQEWSRAILINGWTRENSSLMLPTYFTGRARDFYMTLDVRTKSSAARTLEALHSHYDSAAVRHQAKSMAGDRIQKNGESVSDFFTVLSALVRKAFAHLGKEAERERLKEMFIKGLRPNLRKVFWSNDPENIESALLLAENREAYLKSKRKLGLEVNVLESDAAQQPTRKEDKLGGISSQLLDMQLKFDNFRVDVKKELENRDNQMRELKELIKNHSINTNTVPRTFQRTGTCWGCGKGGHMRSNCPELQKSQ